MGATHDAQIQPFTFAAGCEENCPENMVEISTIRKSVQQFYTGSTGTRCRSLFK